MDILTIRRHREALLFILFYFIFSPVGAQKYVGGDISMLPEYETYGARYIDKSGAAITGDMIDYFKSQGWNAMRVRLFVDPSKASQAHKDQGVRQDFEYVKALCKRIKAAGLNLMLDFHYSDTWTDPGQHSTPSGWTSTDPDQLATTLYNYTKNCLQQLNAEGATPDFIQPGNEITYGMLWPTGHCYPDGGNYGSGTFANFAKYLKAGIQAIREECPQAKVVVQTEMSRATNVTSFYNTLKQYTDDYDVIGISYYPHYHGTLSTLNSLLNTLESNYPAKKIQIVETAYYHKWYPDDAKYAISNFPNWPATESGQQQFTKDLIATLSQHTHVDGLYWWFPEANEYGVDSSHPVTPSGWCNYSLFDNESGVVMNALFELKTFTGAVVDDPDVTSQYLVNATFDSDLSGWTNTDGTAQWKQNTWEVLSNYCEFAWTGSAIIDQEVVQTPVLPAGNYRLSVNCATNSGAKGVFLIAGDQSQEMAGTGGIGFFSVDFTVATEGAVKLGLQLRNTTATWVNFDNFSLKRLSATGIDAVRTSSQCDGEAWYTLDGIHLQSGPSRKGVYIHGGHKYVVR